jgi:hypothetical protein
MYYLSLCCIIKDERYLEEFILYNRLLGVEHFYIYDNNSAEPIKNRLNSFFYKQICTIIDFPGSIVQLAAYTHCINTYKNETDWLIVCDGDEYILPLQHQSLRDFLNEYDDMMAVGINWVFYGTSFHEYKQDGLLIDKYRYRNNNQDQHIKTICKPRFTISFNEPHSVNVIDPSKYVDPYKRVIAGPFNHNYTIDKIRINHYCGRSIEENIIKYHRGYPDGNQTSQPPDNINAINNDMIDNLIVEKYMTPLLSLLRLTGIDDLIYKALNPDLWHINTKEEIYNHAFSFAQLENRPLHINDKFPHFSKDCYRHNYPQFNHLDDLHLELHYIYNGSIANDICDKYL